ncbi:MAG: sensor domain-containing diguanylate cyclase [Candidatus Korobacteraceae bacterium]|jgi:diguanylate cyclase (GGDEF)-like protein
MESDVQLPGLPGTCIVEPFSQFGKDTVHRRWQVFNTCARLFMLTGFKWSLEEGLGFLCDLTKEIVHCSRGMVYFWGNEQPQTYPLMMRGMQTPGPEVLELANRLNLLASRYRRPLLIARGVEDQLDLLWDGVGAESLLVVPLFAHTHIVGALQLFGATRTSFTKEDAHLLWLLSLSSEKLLGQEYSNEALIQQASTDYLTGLKTRRYFQEQLARELKRAKRNRGSLALIMIDIDHFKRLNDEHGHLAGDMLLRQVSSILMQGRREIDTIARYGGEEFVLLLPDTTSSGAQQLAERLKNDIEGSHLVVDTPEKAVRLTVSLGVAAFPRDAQSDVELLAAADAALYGAKHAGRNRVMIYQELQSKQERRREARLNLSLPVQSYGMDIKGNFFEQQTMTVDIAENGARVHGIAHLLDTRSILALQYHGKRARFRVAWLGGAGTPLSSQVGLQLVDEGKQFWEIAGFPPVMSSMAT